MIIALIFAHFYSYLVERIMGLTFCNDNGTTVSCSDGKYITEKVNKTTDPKLAALNITHSTARLFRIFGMTFSMLHAV